MIDDRVSDQHDELFHYTTVPAFESIYKSRTFWATHYEGLNDSSELQLFRRKLDNSIRPIIREILAKQGYSAGDIDTRVKQDAAIHLDDLHRLTFGERGLRDTFICSFCTHDAGSAEARHGLLSQWRGYGVDGGVAIVLDTRGIEKLMEHERTTFAHPVNHIGNVIYDDEDAKVRNDFHLVFELLPKLVESSYSNEKPDPSLEKMLEPFLFGTTLVKHRGFREEQEVRIVVSPRPTNAESIFYKPADTKQTKEILYRQKGDCEVRYIKLFGVSPLPIKRVIVGPSRFQNLNHQKIYELVKCSDIKVVKSEIPFLG